MDTKEVFQAIEIFFHNEADTLSGQWIARKVTVIGLVIYIDSEVPIGEQKVFEVEISDERCCRSIYIVTVSKLSIKK